MSKTLRRFIEAALIAFLLLGVIALIYCSVEVVPGRLDDMDDDIYYQSLSADLQEIISDNDNSKDLGSVEWSDDMFCWMVIDGCCKYPVMKAPASDRDYYLDHRADGMRSSSGSLFVREGEYGIDNIIVYGHNMRNGKMFGVLKKYRDTKWAEEHRRITIIDPSGVNEYEVFAVVIESADNRKIKWEKFVDVSDDRSEQYYELAGKLSVVDLCNNKREISGKRYLTLVTCDNSVQNGRLVVIAAEV